MSDGVASRRIWVLVGTADGVAEPWVVGYCKSENEAEQWATTFNEQVKAAVAHNVERGYVGDSQPFPRCCDACKRYDDECETTRTTGYDDPRWDACQLGHSLYPVYRVHDACTMADEYGTGGDD